MTSPTEARTLMAHLEEEHPELAEEFDAVLFEAYADVPDDPKRQYERYRVPLPFGARVTSGAAAHRELDMLEIE